VKEMSFKSGVEGR